MTPDQPTPPAPASSPDADRDGPDTSSHLPEWLVHFLALLMLALYKHRLARRQRRSGLRPSWCHDRPDLPPGSAQALAASIRRNFGTAIAWMCLRHGIGPGHPDWPYLSRTIVTFGGSLSRFRPGLPALGLQWFEDPNIIPGLAGEATSPPAATARALQRARLAVGNVPSPAPEAAPATPPHAPLPASRLSECSPARARGPAVPARQPGRPCPGRSTFLRLIHGARAWPAPPF